MRGETGVSSGFQGYYAVENGPAHFKPTPETGNEMFISFYPFKDTKCPLYCEKSGICLQLFW